MENIVKILFGEYSAKINITRDANCISLKNSKYNASVLREPDYSKPLDNPYLYGMPILFCLLLSQILRLLMIIVSRGNI